MRKNSVHIILSLCVLLFASCAKEGPTGPTGPAGPVFYGTISGHVSLYDKYGSKVLNNLNKASILINTSSIPALADASGYYSFSTIGTGIYSLTGNDSGYATTVLNNVNFISGTLNRDIKLSAIPDAFVTAFSAAVNSSALVDSLKFIFTADTRARKCIVFVGGSNVSNNPSLFLVDYIINIPANTTALTYAIPQQDLLDATFTSGATVYYAAYSYVVDDASVYEDPATGKNIYNAVNTTPIVASTIVP